MSSTKAKFSLGLNMRLVVAEAFLTLSMHWHASNYSIRQIDFVLTCGAGNNE